MRYDVWLAVQFQGRFINRYRQQQGVYIQIGSGRERLCLMFKLVKT